MRRSGWGAAWVLIAAVTAAALFHKRAPTKSVALSRSAGTASEAGELAASLAVRPEPAPDGTRLDRAARDRVRSLVWQAFGQKAPASASATPATARSRYELPSASPPPPPGAEGRIEASYVRDRMHADFFPMALGCYTEAEKRSPGLTGSIVLRFTIVGDRQIGGVVESADVMDRSTIRDQDMIECIRESMLSMSFPPPDEGGYATVEYPIDFDPEEEG